jgi:cytochrome c
MKTIFVVASLMVGLLAVLHVTAAAERGTSEEAQALVAKAIAAFDEKGPAVFDEINARGFRDRDLYIFVYSTGPDAKIVAYGGPPVTPPVLGRPASDIKDADGLAIGEMFQKQATPDGAWVDYRWKDPVTEEVANKSSWIVRSSNYIFGSGVYKGPN